MRCTFVKTEEPGDLDDVGPPPCKRANVHEQLEQHLQQTLSTDADGHRIAGASREKPEAHLHQHHQSASPYPLEPTMVAAAATVTGGQSPYHFPISPGLLELIHGPSLFNAADDGGTPDPLLEQGAYLCAPLSPLVPLSPSPVACGWDSPPDPRAPPVSPHSRHSHAPHKCEEDCGPELHTSLQTSACTGPRARSPLIKLEPF